VYIDHHLSELRKKEKRVPFYETPCTCITEMNVAKKFRPFRGRGPIS